MAFKRKWKKIEVEKSLRVRLSQSWKVRKSRYDWIFTEKEEKTFREVENLWEVASTHTYTFSLFSEVGPVSLLTNPTDISSEIYGTAVVFKVTLLLLSLYFSAGKLWRSWTWILRGLWRRCGASAPSPWTFLCMKVPLSFLEVVWFTHTQWALLFLCVCVCCVFKESLSVLCASAVHMRWLLPWELRCIFIFFLGKL